MIAALAVAAITSGAAGASPAPQPAGSALGKLPLTFVENRGQVDRRADYYLAGKGTSVFFTGRGLRMSLAGQGITERRHALGLDFVGARRDARPAGRAKTPAELNYLKGARSDWKTGISTYSELIYRDLWPGIDLVYSGSGDRLKYSFLVRPGADPGKIQLAWQGATETRLSDAGELEVSTPAGVLRDKAPYSYQTVDGRRVKVQSSYALAPGNRYGFRLGAHDATRPLVIDPAMLVYAGFIGGSDQEQANNVVLDAARNLYVVGATGSADFPATAGSFDRSFAAGITDAFVAKVNPSGTGLVYATYIGGEGEENGINIDVDASGAAYVGGSTTSGTGFPATVGPDLTYNQGTQDAWVAKLTPSGSALAYAGFIGGAGPSPFPGAPNEQANGLAVDSAGSAYVSGFTGSDEETFPDGTDTGGNSDAFDGVPGYDQTFNSVAPGVLDAFVVKVRPDGTGLDYATYVGGGATDAGTGVTVDGAGNAYLNVFAGSNEEPRGMMNPFGGFPTTQGSFDPTFNGPDPGPNGPIPVDAAVVKLNTAVTGPPSLVYGTYIGGAGIEQPFGNVLDGSGNLYLTGQTGSDGSTFPNGTGFASLSIPGFDQTFNGGTVPTDTFVAKLDATGSSLHYATYVGGSGDEQAVAIDIDSARSAHIFGTTSSTQASFPARGGPDSSYNGGDADAYIAKLTPGGTDLSYAGYVGGNLEETGIGVAVDRVGAAYVAGGTDSDQGNGFPVRVGPDTTFNGPFADNTDIFGDAFVAKIADVATNTPPPAPPPGASFADCPTSTANVIRGTAASNSIVGTLRADRIFAGTGDDVVDGLAGDDCIDLGAGTDRAQGGGGADLVVGALGPDRLAGDSGSDRLRGGASADRLTGGSGNDRLHGQADRDRLRGERGRDRLSGGSSRDLISGGSSGDRIAGEGGNDRINGNSGNDSIRGNWGRDRLTGSSGRDRISGGSGGDRIHARDGRRDRVDCGSGRDRVVADREDRIARNCERVRRSRS